MRNLKPGSKCLLNLSTVFAEPQHGHTIYHHYSRERAYGDLKRTRELRPLRFQVGGDGETVPTELTTPQEGLYLIELS